MARSDPELLERRVEALRGVVEREPEDASSWWGLGRALLDLGRAAEAIVPLRRALAADPRYTAAHRDLGRALLEAGSSAEAVRVLEGALVLARENGDIQTGREVETFLRRVDAAEGRERRAPTTRAARRDAPLGSGGGPEDETTARARGIYREGFQLFADERYDDALERFRAALEVAPDLAIAWNGISLAHRMKGELDAAVEAGQRLIELEPDDPLSHTNLSILLMRQGLIPEAEEERAIAMQLQMRAQGGGG